MELLIITHHSSQSIKGPFRWNVNRPVEDVIAFTTSAWKGIISNIFDVLLRVVTRVPNPQFGEPLHSECFRALGETGAPSACCLNNCNWCLWNFWPWMKADGKSSLDVLEQAVDSELVALLKSAIVLWVEVSGALHGFIQMGPANNGTIEPNLAACQIEIGCNILW